MSPGLGGRRGVPAPLAPPHRGRRGLRDRTKVDPDSSRPPPPHSSPCPRIVPHPFSAGRLRGSLPGLLAGGGSWGPSRCRGAGARGSPSSAGGGRRRYGRGGPEGAGSALARGRRPAAGGRGGAGGAGTAFPRARGGERAARPRRSPRSQRSPRPRRAVTSRRPRRGSARAGLGAGGSLYSAGPGRPGAGPDPARGSGWERGHPGTPGGAGLGGGGRPGGEGLRGWGAAGARGK